MAATYTAALAPMRTLFWVRFFMNLVMERAHQQGRHCESTRTTHRCIRPTGNCGHKGKEAFVSSGHPKGGQGG